MIEYSTFTVTPMSMEINIRAGEVYDGYITVANPADSTRDFAYKVEVAAYGVKDENYVADFLTETERSQITKWITIENPTGMLAPNETVKIHYVVRVPETAPSGGQYAAFMVSSNDDTDTDGSVLVSNVYEMASILYARVGGEYIHDGEFLGSEMPGFVTKLPILIGSTFKNDGNVHEDAEISFEVRNFFTSEVVYPKTSHDGAFGDVIMPETTRYAVHQIDGISPLGIYNVSQTINYMGQTYTVDRVVMACPLWFMALLVVLAVATIAGIVFSIKRHRRKKNIL